MSEFFKLLSELNLTGLFIRKTQNPVVMFFRYLFVGGISFIADAGLLYILESAGLFYLLAAAVGFVSGLTVNFFLSKKFVFTENAVIKSSELEFAAYGIIGMFGLGFTELFMYILTGLIGLYFMLSKIIVTVIVLIWNYGARKVLLYRK